MRDDDDIIDVLAGLDPVGDTPVPGSARYDSILENAMTLIDNDTTVGSTRTDSPTVGTVTTIRDGRRDGRRRWVLLGAAAAMLGVTAAGALVLRPDAAPSAEAAVRSAAAEFADITSLRATLITEPADSVDGQYEVAMGEFADGNISITNYTMNADDTVAGSSGVVVLDGMLYDVSPDGDATSEPLPPEGFLAPFAEASAAVVEAALDGSEVTADDTTTDAGVDTRHVELTMTVASRAALAQLSPQELAWFELEYPDDIDTVEVWVADGLIRQIRLTGDQGVTDIDYSDFNDDIVITAPEG